MTLHSLSQLGGGATIAPPGDLRRFAPLIAMLREKTGTWGEIAQWMSDHAHVHLSPTDWKSCYNGSQPLG